MMEHLVTERLAGPAGRIANSLKARRQTVAIAESSAGGLISAALLAVPGASAYFLGGAVIYTRTARSALLGISEADMATLRASTEPYARLMAQRMREKHAADWALSETGATGPTGNRYGDAAGHACVGISGPATASATIETGLAGRFENMLRFAAFALETLAAELDRDGAVNLGAGASA